MIHSDSKVIHSNLTISHQIKCRRFRLFNEETENDMLGLKARPKQVKCKKMEKIYDATRDQKKVGVAVLYQTR